LQYIAISQYIALLQYIAIFQYIEINTLQLIGLKINYCNIQILLLSISTQKLHKIAIAMCGKSITIYFPRSLTGYNPLFALVSSLRPSSAFRGKFKGGEYHNTPDDPPY